jgi:hypothetical protein
VEPNHVKRYTDRLDTAPVTRRSGVRHGVSKLKSNCNDFEEMGFGPGILWGTLIAIVEFVGGIAVLLGLYAELAATLFGFQMMVEPSGSSKSKKHLLIIPTTCRSLFCASCLCLWAQAFIH